MEEQLCSLSLPPSPTPAVESPSSAFLSADVLIAPPSPFADPACVTPPPPALQSSSQRAFAYLGTPFPWSTPPSPTVGNGDSENATGPTTPRAWIATATQTDPVDEAVRPPAKRSAAAQTVPVPTKRPTASRRVQTEPCRSPRRKVRKNIFAPHLKSMTVFPPEPHPTTTRDHLVVDTTRARRMCDCAGCVTHNLDIVQQDVREDPPTVPCVRFIRLPIQCRVSDARDRSTLDQVLRKRPHTTFVVCGCDRCKVHRNLLHAFVEAVRLTAPTSDGNELLPPPAGGCHGPGRD